MESHMDRFRVRLPSASAPSSSPSAGASVPNATPTSTPMRGPKVGSADPSPASASAVVPPPAPPPPSGRIIACDRCRHFKKKCSKTPPECTTCAAAGLKCSLATVTPASTAELRARLAWLEGFVNQRNLLGRDHAIQQLPTGADLGEIADKSGGGGGGPGSLAGPSPRSAAGSALSQHDSPTMSFRAARVRRLDDDSSIAEDGSAEGPPVKRVRLESLSTVGDKPADDAVLHVLPERPEEQTGRIFVDAYFRDVNRAYPFVDRNRILATLEAEGGRVFSMKDRDADSIIVYLIMAIGYTTLQRAGQVPPNVDLSFEVEYKEVLSECLAEESFDTVQILLLLAIYSVSDPRGFSTRPIVDMLARQAIRLGLTQRDLADKGLTPPEVERNHRLLWSIYVLDRMVAASTGTPVALNDANMNVPLPGITVDEFASPDSAEVMSMLQVARHIIQLRQLEDEVLHQVHLRERASTSGLTHSDRRTVVVNLRTAIEDWYSNGCLLRSTAEVADDVRIHIRISWLAARYYNLLLLLYYPSHFNPTSSLLSKAELLSLAQKHVQANAVRFQHRQLPLNHITLCRLLPVCMVFLHCFLSAHQPAAVPPSFQGGAGLEPAPAHQQPLANMREEVSIVADMMEAFPRHFTQAHRAAAITRQLASVVASAQPSTVYDPTGRSSISSSIPQPNGGAPSSPAGCLSESERAWVHAIRVGLTEVAEQVLGRGSAFRFVLDEGDGGGGTGGSYGGAGGSGAGLDHRSSSTFPNGPLAGTAYTQSGASASASRSASAGPPIQQQFAGPPQPLPQAPASVMPVVPAQYLQQQQQQQPGLPPPAGVGSANGVPGPLPPPPPAGSGVPPDARVHNGRFGLALDGVMASSGGGHDAFHRGGGPAGRDELEYAMIQAGDGDREGARQVSIMDYL